jgi:hypothetical protein
VGDPRRRLEHPDQGLLGHRRPRPSLAEAHPSHHAARRAQRARAGRPGEAQPSSGKTHPSPVGRGAAEPPGEWTRDLRDACPHAHSGAASNRLAGSRPRRHSRAHVCPRAESMGFEPMVSCPTHDFQSCAFVRSASSPCDTAEAMPPDEAIVNERPFWGVTAGSCAIGNRESSQGREAAALSGTAGVPQIAWPSRPRTGARARSPWAQNGGMARR